ncbi:MAG: PepSY domain-containing protein [Anaerovoracaceae bacterium]|jgi:uncharacterized membrane protein YkoI
MKKRTAFLLVIVLAAALIFAGCSGDNSDSTSSSGSQSSGSTQQEESSSRQSGSASQKISREEAVEIVLDRVDGAEESDIHELEVDHDDGQFVYEGELRYDGYEYDFEIDGRTGEIIQWEIDRD